MRALVAAGTCLLLAMSAANAAGVSVEGMVQHPKTYTIEELKALPATTVELRTETMHGTDDHRWTGPLLWSLLATAGLKDEPGKRTTVRHAILVTGADGYAATLAIGEIDPALEGKQVILATTSDGPPLAAAKLVVPGDKHGARDIHDVATVTIKKGGLLCSPPSQPNAGRPPPRKNRITPWNTGSSAVQACTSQR